MTRCPKCGFEQPFDRFCAKCGIQMDAFVPSRPTLVKQLLGSSIFYGLLTATLFGASVWFIYEHSKLPNLGREEAQQAAASPGSLPVPSNAGAPPPPPPAPPPSGQVVAAAAKAELDSTRAVRDAGAKRRGEDLGAAGTDPSSENSAPQGFAATSGNTANRKKSDLEVLFLKVDQSYADNLTQNSPDKLMVGSPSAGIIPQFKARLEQGSRTGGIDQLAADSRSYTLNQPTIVFEGGRDPHTGENMGFFVDVMATRQTDKGLEVKVNIRRILPEPTATGESRLVTVNLDESFIIPPGSAAFMGGILPRTAAQAADVAESYSTIGVLKPLVDRSFLSNASEFVILIAPSLTE